MSLPIVPPTHREDKSRQIAADPKAVFQVSPALHLVRSQRTSHTFYEVTLARGFWTCTCPDHRRTALNCKHIMAVMLLQRARKALDTWSVRRNWPPDEVLANIETRLLAGNLGEREILTLKVYRSAAAMPRIAFALRYYWPDHSPEVYIDPIYGPYQPEAPPVEISTPAQWPTWRPLQGTVPALREYIDEHKITHGPIYSSTSRRVGRWEGHFHLLMLAAQTA